MVCRTWWAVFISCIHGMEKGMHRFWESLLAPLIRALAPRVVLEIGMDKGEHTRRLLHYAAGRDCVVHVVDPNPMCDVRALKETWGERFQLHQGLSLNVLPHLPCPDMALIDGDHNWYTVYSELELLEQTAARHGKEFPCIALHDVAWPYGRRDMYHDPGTIPKQWRKPYARKGLLPGSDALAEHGGCNRHLCNAVHEEGRCNGVLTAVEDFLAPRSSALRFMSIPGFHGLGLLYPASLPQRRPEIAAMLQAWEQALCLAPHVQAVEERRLAEELRVISLKRASECTEESRGLSRLDRLAAENRRLVERIRQKECDNAELERNVAYVGHMLRRFERDFADVLASRRWKIGDAVARVVERLTRRRHPTVAKDRILENFTIIHDRLKNYSSFVAPRRTRLVSAPRPVLDAAHFSGQGERSGEQDLNPQPLPSPPGVSVIILNRNGADHLRAFFASFLACNTHPGVQCVVVDHDSSDESLEVLREYGQLLDVEIVARQRNYSFSESNNHAAQFAKHEILLFMNNDLIFERDVLGSMCALLHAPQVGIVGAQLLYPKDSEAGSGVQHAGVLFRLDGDYGFFRPYNLRMDSWVRRFPAVTGAALMCRKTEFLALGGFNEEYNYGYEDVDFCLVYQGRFGKECRLLAPTGILHNESATQKQDVSDEISFRRMKNTEALCRRFGYAVKKRWQQDVLRAPKDRLWTHDCLTIGFVVTEAHENATAGDYFTAMELAAACERELHCETRFLPCTEDADAWYDVGGVDVLVVLLDKYDIRRTYNREHGLLTVAWLRNWFQRWMEQEWFQDYDLYLCSSERARDYVEREHGVRAEVFPIAANPERFPPAHGTRAGFCFTGHKWGVVREIEEALEPGLLREHSFSVYGENWGDHPKFAPFWKGKLPYEDVPKVYAAHGIVIDDTVRDFTKPWGSVNSRVFDALASGALVVTNNRIGAQELFNGLLPSYDSPDELHAVLRKYLNDGVARAELAAALQRMVLEGHTYRHRAKRLGVILSDFWRNRLRFSIKVPVPHIHEAQYWGDYHFALALRRALKNLGHTARIDILPEWDCEQTLFDDVVLVLRGLSEYRPSPHNVNILWVISHPDKVSPEELRQYDHVYVASGLLARQWRDRLPGLPVEPLPQCADPRVFAPPLPEDEAPGHDVLFVGNSRKQRRRMVADAVAAGIPLAVYGRQWEGLIPEELVRGEHIPNTRLAAYYARAGIVLNDHWESMRRNGLLSNRLFDAGACGAFVISDDFEDPDDIFQDAVVRAQGPEQLAALVQHYLAHPEERRAKAEALREIVLKGHTFAHRAEEIVRAAQILADAKNSLLPRHTPAA